MSGGELSGIPFTVLLSRHVTRMAVILLDPPLPKPPVYANFTPIEPELLPIEVIHCGNREFHVFFPNNSEKYYNFPIIPMQMTPKHIFWPIIDCFNLYASRVKGRQSVVLRRIGGHGHFRSRDKEGGRIIPSAMFTNALLYANCTALLWNCGYCRLKFYIAGIGNFACFLR